MFKYKGCTGKKILDFEGKYYWDITYEDGTHDMAFSIEFCMMLCDGRLKRA